MRTIEFREVKAHLSQLIEEVTSGKPFIIAKGGKPLVKVLPLNHRSSAGNQRVGFMAGKIKVPRDFDRMGKAEIESFFGLCH